MRNVSHKINSLNEANRELEDYANQRIPLPKRNLSVKDEDLLKKVTMIASAVKVDEPPLVAPDMNELYVTEEILRRELPSEKRILVDELYKILYFNNQDPETVSRDQLQLSIVQHPVLVRLLPHRPWGCQEHRQLRGLPYHGHEGRQEGEGCDLLH